MVHCTETGLHIIDTLLEKQKLVCIQRHKHHKDMWRVEIQIKEEWLNQ